MNLRELAKKALERAKEQPAPPTPATMARDVLLRKERVDQFREENDKPARSEDALDRRAFQRGGFSKAEKRAYAQQKFLEELVQPPKEPPPEWQSDPSKLPKKPPPKKKDT